MNNNNNYYDDKFNERKDELEELVQIRGMTPYQVIGYYIHHMEQLEIANKKLVEYIGKDKTKDILRKGN